MSRYKRSWMKTARYSHSSLASTFGLWARSFSTEPTTDEDVVVVLFPLIDQDDERLWKGTLEKVTGSFFFFLHAASSTIVVVVHVQFRNSIFQDFLLKLRCSDNKQSEFMEGEDQNQNEWGGVGGGVGGFIFRFNVWSFFILTRLVSSGELNPSDRYLILPWLIPCTSYRPRTRSSVISSPRERETEKGRKRQTVPSSQQRDKINCIKERNENETRRGLPPPLSHRQCALLCSALAVAVPTRK